MLAIFAETAASDALKLPPVPAGWWIGLIVIVLGLILVDLFVLNREAHEISVREASISSAVWIAIGLSFGVAVWFGLGSDYGAQYFTGYIIEKSLSVDNVFVWAVILGYFAVPKAYQHRVLFWGIFGALILRTIFVFAGVELLERFSWLIVVFGGFLVFTGIRVATHSDEEIHPDDNPILKLLRKRVAMTNEFHGASFFIREGGKRLATPMFAVLVLVEATDVVFAVDSIPAILAISRDPFIVLSSNAFAILGLRALFFVLAGFQDRLVHLNKGLGIILVFVGIKMLLASDLEIAGRQVGPGYHIPIGFSLLFITVVLTVTVVLSLRAAPDLVEEPARSDSLEQASDVLAAAVNQEDLEAFAAVSHQIEAAAGDDAALRTAMASFARAGGFVSAEDVAENPSRRDLPWRWLASVANEALNEQPELAARACRWAITFHDDIAPTLTDHDAAQLGVGNLPPRIAALIWSVGVTGLTRLDDGMQIGTGTGDVVTVHDVRTRCAQLLRAAADQGVDVNQDALAAARSTGV